MNNNLLLVVAPHRQFGWKLYLYAASLQDGGSYRILGLPNLEAERERGASEAEIALLKAVDEVSDEALLKAYSREKDKTKIPQSTIDNLIRPRLETNCSKILELALKAGVLVFLRDATAGQMLFSHNQLTLLPEPSRCLFNFIKDERGLRYFVAFTNRDEEILLQQKPAIVLAQEPCVVLLGDKIHRVENIDAKKLLPFFTKTHIDVPMNAEKKYIETFVLKTIPKFDVRIEGIEMSEISPMKSAILVLEEDVFYARLVFSLWFQYDDQRFRPTMNPRKRRVVALEEIGGKENICWFDRDLDWENKLATRLLDLGLQLEGDNQFYLQNNPEITQRYGLIDWMTTNLAQLTDFHIEQKTEKTYYQGTIKLQSQVLDKIDWFDLDIAVVFEGFSLPFNRFRRHILDGNPEYVLPNGTIFILPEEWFHRYHELFQHTEDTTTGLHLNKMHTRFLQDSLDEFFPRKRKKDLARLTQTPVDAPKIAEHLEKILRPYQKEGVYWLEHLRKMNFGGCLADDMGLGKTLQTIALLDSVYCRCGLDPQSPGDSAIPDDSASLDRGLRVEPAMTSNKPAMTNGKPAMTNGKSAMTNGKSAMTMQLSFFDELESNLSASLVVAPTSLLHNWKNELKRFAPHLRVYIHVGQRRLKPARVEELCNPYNIIITSYGTMRSDVAMFVKYPFHYIILDESQYIKNPDSIVYRSVQKLSAKHKLVLTGTPIENSLSDLWAQFNFINPGLLGNLSSFKKNFVTKIVKEKNKSVEDSLLRMIQPFLLRRTKEEVTPELPPLSEEIVYCDMTDEQAEIYTTEKNSIRNRMLENKEQFLKNNLVALQSLTRLRLLSNHPTLSLPDYTGDSGKFDQIILYFESIKRSGHKVLIFSSFVKSLKLLAKTFDAQGWKYAVLTGQTTDREAEIARFTDNTDISAFFISLKAGGTGLNLTAADYVFIIDPWWNPAAEMQALSRAHRIGQDKKVMVYRFISNDSIEEKILHLQNEKSQLSETFITSNNPLNNLNLGEIEGLFV
ncbi:helicase [Bacteroidia bacterium]|nr:helicase [Bacteroidia bacterium]